MRVGGIVETGHGCLIHLVPIEAVQPGDGPYRGHRLVSAGADDLIRRSHAAQVFQHQNEAVVAAVKIAVQKSRRAQGNVRRQLAVVIEFAPVKLERPGGLECLPV